MEALGVSQAAVARTLGVSPSRIGNWKRADNYPDAFLMTVFCDRYGVTMDYLYRGQVNSVLADAVADDWAKARVASQAAPAEASPPEPEKPAKRRKTAAA